MINDGYILINYEEANFILSIVFNFKILLKKHKKIYFRIKISF